MTNLKQHLGENSQKLSAIVILVRIAICLLMVWSHTDYYFDPHRFPSIGPRGFIPLLDAHNISNFLYRFPTYCVAPGFFFLAGLVLAKNIREGKVYSTWFFIRKSLLCLGFAILLNSFGFGGKFFTLEVLYTFAQVFLLAPLLINLPVIYQLSIFGLSILAVNLIRFPQSLDWAGGLIRFFITGGPIGPHLKVAFPLAGWLAFFMGGLLFMQSKFFPILYQAKKCLLLSFSFLFVFFLLRLYALFYAQTIFHYASILIASKIPPKIDFALISLAMIFFFFFVANLIASRAKLIVWIREHLYFDSLVWYVTHIIALFVLSALLPHLRTNSFLPLVSIFAGICGLTFVLCRIVFRLKKRFDLLRQR